MCPLTVLALTVVGLAGDDGPKLHLVNQIETIHNLVVASNVKYVRCVTGGFSPGVLGEKVAEFSAAARVAQLSKGLGFNLPNALTCHTEGLPHLFESVWAPVLQTKAHFQNFAFTVAQLSQDALELHFGLGSRSVVETIRVMWPSGIVQMLTNVEPNQTITITEAETGS